jgi:hypothetical protein
MEPRETVQRNRTPTARGILGVLRAGLALGADLNTTSADKRLTGVRKFGLHNYRNTALTYWLAQPVNVVCSVLTSVQMHKRYVDCNDELSRPQSARHG